MRIAVHVTHESMKKIGGIGAVLSGVCNLEQYKGFYDKTVFYGPVFELPAETFSNLGKAGEMLFSSHDNYDSADYGAVFNRIIEKYNVDIVYGKRQLACEFDIAKHSVVEVLNVGINRTNEEEVKKFKYRLWKGFGIKSHLYEDNWDYQQYLRIAIPYLEILDGLYGGGNEYYHFAHEYMGVPSVLTVAESGRKDTKVFVAHEVTTARSIVEGNPGHDISFYNILEKSRGEKSFEEVFGSQEHNPRNELIKRAVNFDYIFAVGDHIKDEYQFLVPEVPAEKVKIVYNGVSARSVDIEQKRRSREHIEQYIDALFNFTPDAIFTHVTRLVISKGLWRDIMLLGYLDKIFDKHNLKGAYILLSTVIGTGRNPQDIFRMEEEYGWPVLHRKGWPDLIGNEENVYDQLQLFNARSKAIKAVFINQFGFERARCGKRVPQGAEFNDLRIASDAELGFSIYEPFGIAQIETVPFGGISVLSSSCGAARLLVERFEDAPIRPYYIVDYVEAGRKTNLTSLKNLTIKRRDKMERQVLKNHAQGIFDALPLRAEKRQQYLSNAHKYAGGISWEASAKNYIFDFGG